MIIWNKVTWYSRYLALFFFTIVFPIWTFYLGTQYEKALIADNFQTVVIPVQKGGEKSSTTPVVTTGDTSILDSGIKGTVTIGPTCPVERIPPDPNCAPKSYAASLVAINRITASQTTFKSLSDGTFTVNLIPGDYSIRNASSGVLPRMEDQEITVYPHKYTELNVQFDSGIR